MHCGMPEKKQRSCGRCKSNGRSVLKEDSVSCKPLPLPLLTMNRKHLAGQWAPTPTYLKPPQDKPGQTVAQPPPTHPNTQPLHASSADEGIFQRP
ncbi:hypothetical protein BDW02DRAFT_421330 [Decorospora gaudefroyi]|uniref:Uncharacterized protein n=1 Tax=Decorospora gaudefroyi TaxID=184978 RepID=A0A6A5K822_9PLEO|nr:hypothetical protein BDW02DRAFT_421330 [Decorospora gaudefroyi]